MRLRLTPGQRHDLALYIAEALVLLAACCTALILGVVLSGCGSAEVVKGPCEQTRTTTTHTRCEPGGRATKIEVDK